MVPQTLAVRAGAPRVRRTMSRRRRESLAAAAFLAPDLLGLILFVFLPIGFAIVISFFDWNLISPMKFVGLANYQRLIGDAEWWASLGRTLQFALIYVPLLFALALGLAVAFTKLVGRSGSQAAQQVLHVELGRNRVRPRL